ncbi:hypothetical protein SAMN06265375_1011596 [Muriicola jejuensis]|uniref:STAS/SEC14 domain-containing protein n=1 Tax=Muriicola jejuensis TaxID=504488 RepID=A0A6P0UFP7_9FLAO|nr:STAS/SEC14 domain-containing protein [Muriicola jejuensis]NER08926.1 STAS/SEC14 domain-containing protein [Muriicola jejuensis]SMP12836.1 hypothetical protein SAMN06265375_1011596 [Muriicola jejuensis]
MKVGPIKTPVVVKEYILDIGTVQVFDNYMVSIFNEGCTVTLERAYQLIGITEIHFRNKPFGYISYRKNSYAIDPNIYSFVRELENLKAFAIVSVKEMDMHNFTIEKMFYKKPMKFFIDYNNALAWVKRRVLKK